jgi:Zn-dependent peptidase ImmA (M78 family)/DNA-binding XRE family transcriptional regulator
MDRLMTSTLMEPPAIEIGDRLRKARENANLTQADAAEAIGIARTTLIAIEQGQRRIRIEEAQRLAKVYGISLNALLRQEALHVDLVPRFRKILSPSGGAIEHAAELLGALVAAEVELENLLGIKRIPNLPPERPILLSDVRTQAQQDALWLRQWLGLSQTPIQDIVALLELELGVRVFVRPLQPKISGLFAYDDGIGACILLNSNHPRERRALSAAHELGHLVSTRRTPEVFEEGVYANAREERYANAFAYAFLMPERTVAQRFQEIAAGADKLTRRHIIILAHAFGVSREALTRRLEELKLVHANAWDWFADNGGISDKQALDVLGEDALIDRQKEDGNRPTSLRLSVLAEEAWRRGLMSEGQLARLLRIERTALRRMLDSLADDDEPNGTALPQ